MFTSSSSANTKIRHIRELRIDNFEDSLFKVNVSSEFLIQVVKLSDAPRSKKVNRYAAFAICATTYDVMCSREFTRLLDIMTQAGRVALAAKLGYICACDECFEH